MRTAQVGIAIGVLVVLAAVGIWDIYVMAKGEPDDTVSSLLRSWSRVSTILPFVVGLILGHIFLCSCGPRERKEVDTINSLHNP